LTELSQTLQLQFGGTRPLLRALALLFLFAFIGLLFAVGQTSQLMVEVTVISLVIAFIAARFPALSVAFPLVIFALIGIGLYGGITLGDARLNLADMLIIPALAPTAFRVLSGRRRLSRPDISVTLLGFMIIMATLTGIYFVNDAAIIRNELHTMLYIPVAYFWAMAELRSRNDVRLFIIVFITATAAAGLKSVAANILGSHITSFNYMWQIQDITSEQLGGSRTILGGADTLFVLVTPLLAAMALYLNRRRNYPLLILAALPVLAGLLLGLTRTNLAVAIASLLLVLALGARKARLQAAGIALSVTIIAAAAILVFSSFSPVASNYNLAELMQRRMAFDPNVGSGTLDYRIMEGEALLDTAREHIFIGSGFGSRYSYVDYLGRVITNWSHNGYLWLILKAGLLGLTMFCLAIAISVRRSLAIARTLSDDWLKIAAIGMSVALLALVSMSVLVNRFVNPEGAYFLGLALAVPMLLGKIEPEGSAQTEQVDG
jgi:O-antigen ligase